MTRNSELGKWGEDRACEYLVENGYKIKCCITKYESHCVDTPEDLEKLLKSIK